MRDIIEDQTSCYLKHVLCSCELVISLLNKDYGVERRLLILWPHSSLNYLAPMGAPILGQKGGGQDKAIIRTKTLKLPPSYCILNPDCPLSCTCYSTEQNISTPLYKAKLDIMNKT